MGKIRNMFGKEKLKTLAKWLAFVVSVFVIGGSGGVYFRGHVVPSLVASFPGLSRMELFRDVAGSTMVIERKEQMVVREDDSVETIVSQPATAVVNIVISLPNGTSSSVRESRSRTGVILTNDGVVATYGDPSQRDDVPSESAQVPYPGSSFHVLLYDGSDHEAKFLGYDRLTNLSFLRIDGTGFPAIALANSDDSAPGKKLVAIGNAYEEYQNRFSIGVLSNRNKLFNLSGKTVASSEKWEGVFEADIADPSPYLGGPAVNFRGEMVGLFGSVVFDGKERHFLLPSNVVRDTLSLAVAGKLSDRASLGAYYLTLTKASAVGDGASGRDRGALIYSPSGKTGLSVLAGSPAAKAGLRFGDIVIAVDGKEINLDNPLSVAIGGHSKGDEASLLVLRDGKELAIPVRF
ncbi:MAG: serine protease [Candidatus Moranbacteria bacterium]|nr:serine protease [Candidatus Moranbacteria bacterium]